MLRDKGFGAAEEVAELLTAEEANNVQSQALVNWLVIDFGGVCYMQGDSRYPRGVSSESWARWIPVKRDFRRR